MSETTGPVYARQDYAGFLRRTLALLIDVVILIALWCVFVVSWHIAVPAQEITDEASNWISIVWFVLSLIYLLGFRLTTRGTPGYRIVGIRYAYMLSGKAPRTSLAFRSIVALFLLWFFALDHFWILFDRRKQAWHDKVSGFYVVKRNAKPVGTRPVVRRVINFMMLTFFVWEPADDKPAPANGGRTH